MRDRRVVHQRVETAELVPYLLYRPLTLLDVVGPDEHVKAFRRGLLRYLKTDMKSPRPLQHEDRLALPLLFEEGSPADTIVVDAREPRRGVLQT